MKKSGFLIVCIVVTLLIVYLLVLQNRQRRNGSSEEKETSSGSGNHPSLEKVSSLKDGKGKTSVASQVKSNDMTSVHNMNSFSNEQFIAVASLALKEKRVPLEEREASVEYSKGYAVVTFLPKREKGKPLSRAGRFIVTIDESTGQVVDLKVWR